MVNRNNFDRDSPTLVYLWEFYVTIRPAILELINSFEELLAALAAECIFRQQTTAFGRGALFETRVLGF